MAIDPTSATGFGTDAAFETAVAVLRSKGAVLVEIRHEAKWSEARLLSLGYAYEIDRSIEQLPAVAPLLHP